MKRMSISSFDVFVCLLCGFSATMFMSLGIIGGAIAFLALGIGSVIAYHRPYPDNYYRWRCGRCGASYDTRKTNFCQECGRLF